MPKTHTIHNYGRCRQGSAVRVLLFVALISLVLSACRTGPDFAADPQMRADNATAHLERLVQGSYPTRTFVRIEGLRDTDLVSAEELDQWWELALEATTESLSTAIDEGAYRRAVSMFRSLVLLEEEQRAGDLNLDILHFSWAEHYLEENNAPAALNVLLRMPGLETLTDESLQKYATLALEYNDSHALGELLRIIEQRELENSLIERSRSHLSRETDPGEMIAGTATVWVNKGIRIDRGVGRPDQVIGSGFFIDRRGYLITNYHVISSEVDPTYRGYSRLYVRLPGAPDERIPARVVGYDRIFDVALLKVEIEPDYVFSLTDIRDLRPGASIYAIGSPGGLYNTITSGIISAGGRRFLQMGDALQVDAPVNPGNSGGPLIAPNGDLIGVVFAGIPQFEGINFAIPSFWVQYFLPQLFEEGEAQHPWMGVAVHETRKGFEVMYVARHSPADQAGLQVGDLITEIEGHSLREISEGQSALLARGPGELVRVSLVRDELAMERMLVLEDRPFSPLADAFDRSAAHELFPALFGMEAREVGQFPWQSNYVVSRVYPGSIADETGLSANDPFSLRNFDVDDEYRVAFLQIIVRKRKAGFLESGVQLASLLEIDNFL